MAKVTLDVAHDLSDVDALAGALAQLTEGLAIKARPTGVHTAGGWPEVEFTGEPTQLVQLVQRYVDDLAGSASDHEHALTWIKNDEVNGE